MYNNKLYIIRMVKSSFDINIKEIEYKIDSYGSTKLVLSIEGKDVNHCLINGIRRIATMLIPIYGFDRSGINITRNSSVYDSTEMLVRLSQLPIQNLSKKNNILLFPKKLYLNYDERHIDDDLDINIYIKAKNTNNTPDLLYVTTNDIQITMNNKLIKNEEIYNKDHPILLIKLRQNEEFECSMKSRLSVSEENEIFSACNAYYEEITKNKYIFTIESSGQFTEYEILKKSILIMIERLKLLEEYVITNKDTLLISKENSAIIKILNEDNTCGSVLNYVLQDMDDVIFSGVTKPNLVEKNISITLKVNKNKDLIEIFSKGVNKTIEIYEYFNKLFDKK